MENNAYICTKIIYNKMTMMKTETIIILTIGGRGGKVIHVTYMLYMDNPPASLNSVGVLPVKSLKHLRKYFGLEKPQA